MDSTFNLPQRALIIVLLLACGVAASASSTSSTDLVPRGSGLYDALALLAQKQVLAPGAPDATDFQGVTGRLYTRGEFADMIRDIYTDPVDPRAEAALAFARNSLAPELGLPFGPGTPRTASVGITGFVEPEVGGRTDQGNGLKEYGEVFGRARLLGTLGRDGAFTVSLTNIYRQMRDHASFTTLDAGHGGADNPGALDGVDEAYATVLGRNGFRATVGYLRQRWGSGYQGEMMVSDNAPAHPSLQIEFPFSLGHGLGDYRFTQYETTYNNLGRRIYQGGRRIEHPFGDRVMLSAEETYNSYQFDDPGVLVLPYYAYQRVKYKGSDEPNFFNYNANLGLVVQPDGPSHSARLYGQFFLDDIKAPKGLGQNTTTPRKIGYLLGYAQTFPQSGTDVVLEYAHTDRETYTKPAASQAGLAWFSGDLPLGYPTGPNGKELFLRLGQRLSPRLSMALEARDRRRVSDDFPAPNARALDLAFAYHLSPTRSLGLRFSMYDEDPFTGSYIDPFTHAPAPIATGGGADYGRHLRRRLLAVNFLQSF